MGERGEKLGERSRDSKRQRNEISKCRQLFEEELLVLHFGL